MPSPLSGSPRKCPHAAADSKPSYGSGSQIWREEKIRLNKRQNMERQNSAYDKILSKLWHSNEDLL